MKKLTLAAALVSATMLASPAMAGNPDGKLQVKILATGVLPDGKITAATDPLSITNGTQVEANDNVVPTIAVEYFATPNVSVETICCLTQHHVTGTAGTVEGVNVTGVQLVDHVMILPATVTLKYHFGNGNGIKPYIGAGPSVFFYIDEKPSAAAAGLTVPVTSVKMDNKFGFALQAGVDVPVAPGMGISLDAKKYFMDTKAHFYNNSTEVLTTTHSLDPWVVSGGVFVRF